MQLKLTSSTGRKKTQVKKLKKGRLEKISWFTALGMMLIIGQITGFLKKISANNWAKSFGVFIIIIGLIAAISVYGLNYYRSNVNGPQKQLSNLYRLQNMADKVFLSYSNTFKSLSNLSLSAKEITTGSGWQSLTSETEALKNQSEEVGKLRNQLIDSKLDHGIESLHEFDKQLENTLNLQVELMGYINCLAGGYVKIFEQLNILNQQLAKLPTRPKNEEVKSLYATYKNVVNSNKDNLKILQACWSNEQNYSQLIFLEEFVVQANGLIQQSTETLDKTGSLIDEILVALQGNKINEYQKKLEQLEQASSSLMPAMKSESISVLVENPYQLLAAAFVELNLNHEKNSAELNNQIADIKSRLPAI